MRKPPQGCLSVTAAILPAGHRNDWWIYSPSRTTTAFDWRNKGARIRLCHGTGGHAGNPGALTNFSTQDIPTGWRREDLGCMHRCLPYLTHSLFPCLEAHRQFLIGSVRAWIRPQAVHTRGHTAAKPARNEAQMAECVLSVAFTIRSHA